MFKKPKYLKKKTEGGTKIHILYKKIFFLETAN